MKKIKILAASLLTLMVFVFISCENEPIDPNINLNGCAAPTGFQATSFINNSNVSLIWLAGSDETSWTVEYGPVGFTPGTGISANVSQPNYTVTGLNSSNSYSFYVRASCGVGSFSQWVGPVTVQAIVTNPNCANPAGLTAVRNATLNTNVDLAWTAGGTETAWQIQYGPTGFTLGSGTLVASTTLTKQIGSISASSGYDFYVRANCTATENSGWFGPVNVAAVVQTGTIAGTYKLTAFNTSVPTDLNMDGTASTNQLNETSCNDNMFLILNANNTFSSDSKGTEIIMDIDVVSGNMVETISCFVDPTVTGTWALAGNVLSLSYVEDGVPYTDNYIVSGNTISATLNDGEVVGTELTTGAPVYLTCDITIIYTKQ